MRRRPQRYRPRRARGRARAPIRRRPTLRRRRNAGDRLFEDPRPALQLTVSQFSQRLARWLEKRPELQRIAIVGEVSGWKPQPTGNVFFSLKDDRAILRCFVYSSDAKKLPAVHDGVAVVATGTVGIWPKTSEYQLRVVEIAPLGVGAIAAKVEALRRRLQAEGLFDDARKRELIRFPRRVALVSARGKGADDFETRCARSRRTWR